MKLSKAKRDSALDDGSEEQKNTSRLLKVVSDLQIRNLEIWGVEPEEKQRSIKDQWFIHVDKNYQIECL